MVQTSTNWQRGTAPNPALPYKEYIIALFNSGALLLDSVKWYHALGYALIISGGTLVDIVREG